MFISSKARLLTILMYVSAHCVVLDIIKDYKGKGLCSFCLSITKQACCSTTRAHHAWDNAVLLVNWPQSTLFALW